MINKATFNCQTDGVEIYLPIMKVDKEARTVSGFATLDNDDAHGDIITADASSKAFQRWRGNVREMHQPLAVGKALDFKEEEFYDEKTDKLYRGVFVSVYVSKGAEDTWQKVLDGTLSGFSIGGSIIEKTEYENEMGQKGRMILDYELKELSLVDSPANKFANIMSIQKDDSGNKTVKGMAAETKTQNVYYCEDEGFAFTSDDDIENCRSCGIELNNIGWVEDTIDKHAAVKDLLKNMESSELKAEDGSRAIKGNGEVYISTEGGVSMTKTDEKKEETVEKDDSTEEKAEDVTEETPEDTTEKAEAADVDEVSEEPDLTKVLEQINETVTKAVEDASSKAAEASNEVKTELEKSIEELRSELSTVKTELKSEVDGVKTQVSKFEDGGAVRKASDVETEEDDDDTENFWRGQFLDAESLKS